MKEISIHDIKNIRIGQTEDPIGATGVTVFLSETGMAAGLDVRGGGPASRESQLLSPLAAAQTIHAVVLSGGSAYGLDAGGGVMAFLEEKGIGFDVGVAKVPLVCQASLFDLAVGDPKARPDKAMGYRAAQCAWERNYRDGNLGAGCGATIGKLRLMERCMKSGIGSCAVQVGQLQVGAVAAVNALGDVYDWRTGQLVAGLRDEAGTGLESSEERLIRAADVVENRFTGNTTLGVVLTNGSFDKSRLCKIAGMAQDGYARSIRPIHTTADGDSIFALSVGSVPADLDVTGTLAALAVSEAILRAVKSAQSACGYPAWRDMKR